FEIFGFLFVYGDPASVLRQPHSVVLTESSAARLFGRGVNPIGQGMDVEGVAMKVTGVVRDVPATSSLRFSMVATLGSLNQIMGPWVLAPGRAWYFPPMYTFVEMSPTAATAGMLERMPAFVDQLLGADF